MAERVPSVARPEEVMVEEKEEKASGAAPEGQPDEVEEVDRLEADPDRDLPEEEQDKEDTRGIFHSRAQMFWESFDPKERVDMTIAVLQHRADPADKHREARAALLDVLVRSGTFRQLHVPRIVRCIYQWLMTNRDTSAEHRLDSSLLALAHAWPSDVVLTVLHCDPSCDRAAATMWRVLVSMGSVTEDVLLELHRVLLGWTLLAPDACRKGYMVGLTLAPTRALYEILQMPSCPQALEKYCPQFFLALLYQISSSFEQMPEEDKASWSSLPYNCSRLAVLAIKALLCQLGCEDVVAAVERKRGWGAILQAETHHRGVGLLAREMSGAAMSLSYRISCYLVKVLHEGAHWEVSGMAFLVELLDRPEMETLDDKILLLIRRFLYRDNAVMHRLVLRALVVLCRRPVMVRKIQVWLYRLIELLQDAHAELASMALSVISKVLQDMDKENPFTIYMTLHLAERLLPLFAHIVDHVRLLSITCFREVMRSISEAGERPLKVHVQQSLLLLWFHLHDENYRVAEASRETLSQAVVFLENRSLAQLTGTMKTNEFLDRLLLEYPGQTDQHLQQSLRYLQCLQDSIRGAAISVLGLLAMQLSMEGIEEEKLQTIYEALQGRTEDSNRLISCQAATARNMLRAAGVGRERSMGFRLQVLLHRMWRRRPSLQQFREFLNRWRF